MNEQRIKQIVRQSIKDALNKSAAKEYIELDNNQLKELKKLLTEVEDILDKVISDGIDAIENKLENSDAFKLSMGAIAITEPLAASRKNLVNAMSAAKTIRDNYEL